MRIRIRNTDLNGMNSVLLPVQEKVFGSKFVTVCVTGNTENEIHMEGYQVSIAFLVSDLQFIPVLADLQSTVLSCKIYRYCVDL